MQIEERFWSKVDWDAHDMERCWPWLTYRDEYGYGRFNLKGRAVLAHRLAYELEVGDIPEGMTIDHLCRNRGCVNPDHMEPVGRVENIMRGVGPSAVHARATHCEKCGGELTQLKSQRGCLPCYRQYNREYHARNRERLNEDRRRRREREHGN